MINLQVEVPTSLPPRLHEPGVAPQEGGGQRTMDIGKDGTDLVEHLDRDLSLQEATRHYDVSLGTLRKRVRCGEIPAYKTRGPWGQEWRVNGRTLEASGLRRRPVELGMTDSDPRVAALEAELATLRRVVVAERERGDQADRELGYAMLECGRLRSALAKALQHPEGCADGTPGTPAGAGRGGS